MNIDYESLCFESLKRLADTYGKSYYLFYPDRFLQNLTYFRDELAKHYPNSLIAYALKANYMPCICAILQNNAFWAEAVSCMEYEIAREFLPANRMIFNGPCKSVDDLRRAVGEGAIVNLDSFHELSILQSIKSEFDEVSIGLRVSFDIGTGTSRFGFNYENGDFSRAVKLLEDLGNVRLVSIHSHFTTRERSLELFDRRARGMINVYRSLPNPADITHINIGGGFFGPMSHAARNRLSSFPPSFDEYACVIGGIFKNFFGQTGPCLVLEPGVSMVADAMDYVVKVIDERTAGKNRYLTVDGSVNCLFPTGSNYKPDYSIFCEGSVKIKSRCCCVVGYTCMEHDVLLDGVVTDAQPGDYFVFHNRGAYSNVYKPPFIKESPAIIGLHGEVYARRQTYRDVIAPYSLGESF